MKTLILETSTEAAAIVLANGTQLYAAKPLLGGPELSKRLALEVKKFLESLSFHPEKIAVGQGPGSYTGIRVGASFAQALAFGWQLPLVGFCSLKAFVPPCDGPFASLIDARGGGLYALKGLSKNGHLSFEEPRLVPLAQAPAYLHGIPHFCSPHPSLKTKLDLPGLWFDSVPNPSFLAQLANETEPQNSLTLTYLSSPATA